MRYSIISLILLFSFSATGLAQKQYTLEECERMALENNRKIKNAGLEVSAVYQTRKEAFTSYFPQVSATGGWLNANKGLLRTEINIPPRY